MCLHLSVTSSHVVIQSFAFYGDDQKGMDQNPLAHHNHFYIIFVKIQSCYSTKARP